MEKSVLITLRNFMFVLGGQLFLQYQNNEMKNIDIIMRESQNKFIHNPVCMKNDDNYFMIVYVSNVQDLFEEILLKIPEFNLFPCLINHMI